MPHNARDPPPSGVTPDPSNFMSYKVFCTKFPGVNQEDWKNLKKDIHMAKQALQDHPEDVILYFGPWGSPSRMVAQVNRSWLRYHFPYCDKKLAEDYQISFLSFRDFRVQEFVQIFKNMDNDSPPVLAAVIDREQCLHYSARRRSNSYAKVSAQHVDPIALYALAEKLGHNGMMMKVIDLLNEFSKTHDALPHESLIERAYKETKIGSSLRRFLLQLWIEEFARQKIAGGAYLHLFGCLDDDKHVFDIRYLQGVYRGLKVNVWNRAFAKDMTFCHCATCKNERCLMCKRGVCNEVQELDGDEKPSADLQEASQNTPQPRDTWWGEYKPTPDNWDR